MTCDEVGILCNKRDNKEKKLKRIRFTFAISVVLMFRSS